MKFSFYALIQFPNLINASKVCSYVIRNFFNSSRRDRCDFRNYEVEIDITPKNSKTCLGFKIKSIMKGKSTLVPYF